MISEGLESILISDVCQFIWSSIRRVVGILSNSDLFNMDMSGSA